MFGTRLNAVAMPTPMRCRARLRTVTIGSILIRIIIKVRVMPQVRVVLSVIVVMVTIMIMMVLAGLWLKASTLSYIRMRHLLCEACDKA